MKKGFFAASSGALFLAALMIGGCASYYQVNQPAGGKTYYTKSIDETDTGAVRFRDASTKDMITLQNSEVREIDKDQYEAGMASSLSPGK